MTNIDLYRLVQSKDNTIRKLIGRQLGLFGLMCRMHNCNQGVDVRENGWHEQERKISQEMARRGYRLRQGVTPGAELSSNGQKDLKELGEDGIGHLRVLSPLCLMMITSSILFTIVSELAIRRKLGGK